MMHNITLKAASWTDLYNLGFISRNCQGRGGAKVNKQLVKNLREHNHAMLLVLTGQLTFGSV